MKTAVFSTYKFEKDFLLKSAQDRQQLLLLEPRLTTETAGLAGGCVAVSLFVNDEGSAEVLEQLAAMGVKYLVLRSAGFNHIDMKAAGRLGIRVARVPEYSPYAVAEHTVALIMALNRKLIRAHNRIMDFNFSLNGLTGFDMNGKTVGIVGTGKIGVALVRILFGFGCRLLAYDKYENEELKQKYGLTYCDFESLCRQSDIISLHVPLNDDTKYMINAASIATMKKGVMLVNTSRGALVNTQDVIQGLKQGSIGYFGMDVYEEEEGLFFEDHSQEILQDDTIARLMTFQNVLITSHQAFLTDTALKNIADTTIYNLDCFEKDQVCKNEITI